jgi:hypothetical protein
MPVKPASPMPSITLMAMSTGYDVATACRDAVSPQVSTTMDTKMWAGMSFHKSDIHSKAMYEM